MRIFSIFLFLMFTGIVFTACDKDDYPGVNDFVVAFENPSENFMGAEADKEIRVVFSQPAPENGIIDIVFTSGTLVYGAESDFIITPEAADNNLRLPVEKGSEGVSFTVHKLIDVLPGEEQEIMFRIASVTMGTKHAFTRGHSEMLLSFSGSASMGGTMRPEIGGPNEPNQVYVSLRGKMETKIRRDVWDLGFYGGDTFHVRLNSSLYMFAGTLNFTDIDAVRDNDVSDIQPLMNFLVDGSDRYVDHPRGDLDKLVIQAISENDVENPVYLLKMGNEIGTDIPAPGGVAVAGAERGWKKIRILRRGDAYLMQYADVNSSNHQEVTITKNNTFNFTFFSFTTESTVNVEPHKNEWDLNFTVAIEIEDLPGAGQTAYGYSDYVASNSLGNVKVYRVNTGSISYSDFSVENIEESKFSKDQRTIGSSWRNTIPPDRGIFTNIFYIIRDSENNYYKLRFTAFENGSGVRGYPEFEYSLLK